MLQESRFAEEESSDVLFGAEDGGKHVGLFRFSEAFEVLDLDFFSGEDE